ncbi:MAG: acyl carrier protein, partial [Desulfobacterium sp.]
TSTMSEFKETIKKFIIENFLFGEEEELKDDTSFLEEGIIDSTGVLELIEFLEEKFNITINDDEIIPENLDSLNNLDNFMLKLTVKS